MIRICAVKILVGKYLLLQNSSQHRLHLHFLNTYLVCGTFMYFLVSACKGLLRVAILVMMSGSTGISLALLNHLQSSSLYFVSGEIEPGKMVSN